MRRNIAQPRAPMPTERLALKELPIPWEAVTRDTAELLGTARRVRTYRAFLAHARSAKAAGRAPDIDRQVYAQARAIHADGARAGAAAARAMRSLHAGGALTWIVDSLVASLKVRPVKGADLWKRVVDTEAFRPHLERHGIDAAALDEFGGLLTRTDITASSNEADVVFEGSVDGQPVSGRLAARRPAGLPRDPINLLTAGRFFALCDALERGEPAYLLGAGPPREPPSLEDLMMTAVLASQREGIRHLRELEDVGLAISAGGGIATVVIVIALAVMLTGIVISAIECDRNNTGINDPDLGCAIGTLMATLGMLVLFGMGAHYGRPAVGATGQTISGPLPQLEGQSA